MNEGSIALLPQSPDSIIKDTIARKNILELMGVLILETIETLKDFYLKNKLSSFDPHVGDTACQLRAYKFFNLSIKKKQIFSERDIFNKLVELNANYGLIKKTILEQAQGVKIKNNSQSILTLFLENNLLIFLGKEIFFLVYSRILTIFKEDDGFGGTRINFEKLSRKFNISRKLAKKFVHYYQGCVAELSCHFVFSLVDEMATVDGVGIILKKLQKMDGDDRPVLPCFASMEVLLAHMRTQETGLLLKITNSVCPKQKTSIYIYCVMSAKSCTYYPVSKLSIRQLKQPVFVVNGSTNYPFYLDEQHKRSYLRLIKQIGVETVLRANMASHPQFSGEKLIEFQKNPYLCLQPDGHLNLEHIQNFNNYFITTRYLAEELGCSLQNNKLFLVEHVFCDLLKNQINFFSALASIETKISSFEALGTSQI